jgi:hypothetical protein
VAPRSLSPDPRPGAESTQEARGDARRVARHADAVASIDLFVVPTISFRRLYGFLVLRHSGREILWPGVTAHPSAEWIARQLTEACGWSEPPQYIIRDRDGAYRGTLIRHLGAMSPTRRCAGRSAKSNVTYRYRRPRRARRPLHGFVDRLIGLIVAGIEKAIKVLVREVS